MKTLSRPQPLDYRTPGTPGPGGDILFRWLCTRHCLGVAGAAIGVAAGTAVLLVAGAAFSGLVTTVAHRFGSHLSTATLFWFTFATYAFLILPLIFWRTLRTGGEFYADQVIEANIFHGKPQSYGSWGYRGDVATTALCVDLLFWGPRLIVDGLRRLAGRDVVRSVATLRRSTYILSHLLQASEAVRTKALRIPNEPSGDFQRVLRWLDAHDYIGISADGQRVWLRSDTRETLSLMLNQSARSSGRKLSRRPGAKPTTLAQQIAQWKGLSSAYR